MKLVAFPSPSKQSNTGKDMNQLLDLAVNAHGGLEFWKNVSRLDVAVSISGSLWRIKGYPAGLPNVRMAIDPHQPSVSITPFSGPDRIGHFEPDRVWISDSEGRLIEERGAPRDAFAGHVRATPWDYLHQLYFAGYAFWNYFTTPFLLLRPDVEKTEIEPHIENGNTWRRLKVKFPETIPTHCADQIFYFDEKGILQRIDYVIDVAGGIAAHYCFDHQAFDGLAFPTLRRVVERTSKGPWLSGPTAVLVHIENIIVS